MNPTESILEATPETGVPAVTPVLGAQRWPGAGQSQLSAPAVSRAPAMGPAKWQALLLQMSSGPTVTSRREKIKV